MATAPAGPAPLSGVALGLASLPMAESPRGGMETSFRGMFGTPSDRQDGESEQPNEFAGMGPLLEDDDAKVFKAVDGLVQRQELIALNHLAQDTHWTYLKLGYPWSTLTKEPNRDVYRQTLPYGAAGITIQAVPNKSWDLINKTTEALLVDFPEAEAEPADDSEEAEAACDMANRFLTQDASEQGTNDAVLFHDRVSRSLTCASSYLECWTDPTGGGYVPLQILAHPLATDTQNPLVGPDGMPTTDLVLRYVTAEGQFTTDASQAAPQWQPKLRASKWQREHIRVYPESATVDTADKVIILGYCTLGEAKRRWQSIGSMAPEDVSALTDWTPPRYLVLLPPFQRARWKLSDGRDKDRAGASDERIMFYYHVFAKASPDYLRGADVVVTGALDGGFVIDRRLLAKEVEVDNGQGKTTEIRCMEIPVVQVTPRGDADEMDPSGRAFIELFAGAAENNAHLSLSFSQIIDQILHTPYAVPSTSPIEGWQVEEARASGDFLLITKPEDKPQQLAPPTLPTAFFDMYELADDAINSASSQNRPSQGSDKQQEVSGKARQIAISQNNVSLSGMQTAVNNAYARWCRVKIERAMADFSTPQQIGYVGEDGAYKADEWTGVDFALIGKVTIKAGTGTLMPADMKVQYLGNLQAAGLIAPDEATAAARPAFSKRLGLQANPHEQFVERAIDSWLKGPPAAAEGQPTWDQQYAVYAQAKAQSDQVMAAYQQTAQQATAVGAQPPQPPAMPPLPPEPWQPFTPRPNDTEPAIAALWTRKLSDVISSVKYTQASPGWRAVLDQKYLASRQAVALAQQAQAAAGAPGAHPAQEPGKAIPPKPAPEAPHAPTQPHSAMAA